TAFHTITATVAVGDQMVYDAQAGTDPGNKNSVMWPDAATSMVMYLDGHLHASSGELLLGTPVTVKLPGSASVAGAWSGNVVIEVVCEPTAQAKAAWVQGVYDALRAAYDASMREWRAQEAMAGRTATLAERSPARHADMIQTELRRHVIAWLLGESPF